MGKAWKGKSPSVKIGGGLYSHENKEEKAGG